MAGAGNGGSPAPAVAAPSAPPPSATPSGASPTEPVDAGDIP
jgi:hypothetical protein